MNPSTALILNPRANRGRSSHALREIAGLAGDREDCTVFTTERAGHATELAREAALANYATVVAAGGDGTVHEVINGLMSIPQQNRPALGVLPLGSGNDFAHGTGVGQDWRRMYGRLDAGETRNVDIGRVAIGDGRTVYWDNTAGIGFDANVTIRSRDIRRLHGFAMYLSATLHTIARRYDPFTVRMIAGGRQTDHRALMLTLCNGPREGGGFNTTPHSVMDDGIFEYLMFTPLPRPAMMTLLPKVLRGTHLKSRHALHGTFTDTVHLVFDRPVPVHCDGEIIATAGDNLRELTIGIERGALRLIV